MKVNARNTATAVEIIKILEKNNCTVEEAEEIMTYVARMSRSTSKVRLQQCKDYLDSMSRSIEDS